MDICVLRVRGGCLEPPVPSLAFACLLGHVLNLLSRATSPPIFVCPLKPCFCFHLHVEACHGQGSPLWFSPLTSLSISPQETPLVFLAVLSCCSFVISSCHPSLVPSDAVHVLVALVSAQAAFRALDLCPKLSLLSLASLMFIV